MKKMVFPVLFGTPHRASRMQSRCFKIGTINVRNLYEKNRAELKEEQEAKGVLLPFRERKAEAMPEAAGRCYN